MLFAHRFGGTEKGFKYKISYVYTLNAKHVNLVGISARS